MPSSWRVVEASEYTDWLAARDRYLTASDVSAIMSLNPNKSRRAVLDAKAAALSGGGHGKSARVVSAMLAGQYLEEGVFEWFKHDRTVEAVTLGEAEPTGGVLRNLNGTSLLVAYPGELRLAASPDALLVYGDGSRQLVEVKVCGPTGSWPKWSEPVKSRAWEKLGRDRYSLGCPVQHYVQLQTQLLCTGETFGWVVGNCGTARSDHPFPSDQDLQDAIIDATIGFWKELEGTP